MDATAREARTRNLTGILLMCAGVACLSVYDAMAKLLTATYSPLQILILRNLIALPVTLAIAMAMDGAPALRSHRPAAHLPRGLLVPLVWMPVQAGDNWLFVAVALSGTTGMTLMTRAFRLAPATIVAPFDYTVIVWATLLGWYPWGERLDAAAALDAAIIVASGIFIILRERRAGG